MGKKGSKFGVRDKIVGDNIGGFYKDKSAKHSQFKI